MTKGWFGLKWRVIGMVLLATILLTGTFCLVFRLVFMDNVRKAEIQKMHTSLETINGAIESHLKALSNTSADWATWDDTYRFVQQGNQDYVDSNISTDFLANIEVDLILFVDSHGELVYGFNREADLRGDEALYADILVGLSAKTELYETGEARSVSGLLDTVAGPVMITARNIFPSDMGRQAEGYLVMGRFLSRDGAAVVGESLGMSLAVNPIDSEKKLELQMAEATGEAMVEVRQLPGTSLAGHLYLPDINGSLILDLQYIRPMENYLGAGKIVWAMLIFQLILGAGVAIVLTYSLDKYAISRITGISQDVQRIGDSFAFDQRLTPCDKQKDEISALVQGINQMLDKLNYLEKEKENAQGHYQMALELNRDVLFTISSAGQIHYITQGIERILGYSPEALLGKNLLNFIYPEDRKHLQELLEEGDRPGFVRRQLQLRLSLDAENWRWFRIILAPDGEDTSAQTHSFAGVLNDIHEEIVAQQALAQAQEELTRQIEAHAKVNTTLQREIATRQQQEVVISTLAYEDYLTKLPNRHSFYRSMEKLAALNADPSQRVSLFFLDLDGFKQINDQLGHDAGDQLLIEASNRIRQRVRKTDEVFRYGGDEFIVVSKNIATQTEARLIADKIIDAFSYPFCLQGENNNVTVSIGIVIPEPQQREAESMVKRADRAMYQAKAQGKNQYAFAD